MIKIDPYYRRPNGGEILKEYLRMVADVTPFFPEDVLFDDEEGINLLKKKRKTEKKKEKEPRQRNDGYISLLNKYGVSDGKSKEERQRADAVLAEKLIGAYSKKLRYYLYGDNQDGRVITEHLRDLLTFKMQEGKLPKELTFDDADGELSSMLQAHVFRYEAVLRHEKLYPFVLSLGVEVCPYCNRMFTSVVSKNGKKTRPQLDHFKNKKNYPYLALSINNLVPSCGVCNLLKRDQNVDMVYPYEEGFGDAYVFGIKRKDKYFTQVMTGARISPEHFDLELKQNGKPDSEFVKRVEGSIKELALTDLYQHHRNYVTWLIYQHYIITDELIDDLFTQFGGKGKVFSSKEEIRAALTLMNIKQEHWGERPLAKLTHDILSELDSYSDLYPYKEEQK